LEPFGTLLGFPDGKTPATVVRMRENYADVEEKQGFLSSLTSGTVTKITFVVTSVAALSIMVTMTRVMFRIENQISAIEKEARDTKTSLQTEVIRAERVSSQTANLNRHGIEEMRAELAKARQEVEQSVGAKHEEALATVQRLSRELKAEEDRQKQRDEAVNGQITDVKQTVSAGIEGVSSDVSKVRTEVAATKTNLDNAMKDLKRVIGDMGVMSGLVATNARELEALKALGDRNYTEFAISKSQGKQTVGEVGVMLKKTDLAARRCTFEIYMDDNRVQKRDRTLNEPIQFYVGSNRQQPYEIVINEIHKDQIVGYLASPKLESTR
jgi:hypothetical protein